MISRSADLKVGEMSEFAQTAAGGVIRDVLASEPSVLLRRELYISAAIVSASRSARSCSGDPAVLHALSAARISGCTLSR